VPARRPMDKPLLHRGVTKTSKGRNNTITKKLDCTDVINTFKASIMLTRYTLNIHALIHNFIEQILLYS
jgi:hypothetical protein